MAVKLPGVNEFLKNIAAINIIASTSRSSFILKSFLIVLLLIENILPGEEVNKYESDCWSVMVDFELPNVWLSN